MRLLIFFAVTAFCLDITLAGRAPQTTEQDKTRGPRRVRVLVRRENVSTGQREESLQQRESALAQREEALALREEALEKREGTLQRGQSLLRKKEEDAGIEDLSTRSKRSHDQWLEIISKFGRPSADGALAPFPVDLPIVGKDGTSSVPVLVLPIPVRVPGPQSCAASTDRSNTNRLTQDSFSLKEDKFGYKEDKFGYKEDKFGYKEDKFGYKKDKFGYQEDKFALKEDNFGYKQDSFRAREDQFGLKAESFGYKQEKFSDKEDRFRFTENKNSFNEENTGFRGQTNKYGNARLDVRIKQDEADLFENFEIKSKIERNKEIYEVKMSETVSSDYLIELWKQQQPRAPELPPAVIGPYPEIEYPKGSKGYLPPEKNGPPSLPKFDKSFKMRGFLTVRKADYTEPYTVWYDSKSGSSRVEYHDGSITSVRSMSYEGRMRRVVRTVDRSSGKEVVKCGVTSPTRPAREDLDMPGLPSLEGFSFAGYRTEFGMNVEVWKKEMTGRPGELGAAPGEILNFRHELLVQRVRDDLCLPLQYTVAVDSSVLGKDCDGWRHIYSEAKLQEHDPSAFSIDIEQQCQEREQLNEDNPEDMARLDPMREFTQVGRDTRFDSIFESFTKQYQRTYSDMKEAVMRKNILVQRSRFISSCNREGATFKVGINFLSDRLDAEIDILLGVRFTVEIENNKLQFPYSKEDLIEFEPKLPKEWDWRPRGGVTPVKSQGVSCMSCWAFAVVGSVEGALYIKTRKLVELSEQSLVDCAHSHKANGCNGTWPVAAFDYITDRGIPARAEYTPYAEKVLQCKAPPVPPVTHIAGGVDVTPNNINALKVAIRRSAPTVVIVDAHCGSFITYESGVLIDHRCIKGPKNKLNHAILAVGWAEENGEPHFIMKNSWSSAWGEGGYVKLHAPSNTCGHLTTPSYPRLRTSDVDRIPGDAAGNNKNNYY